MFASRTVRTEANDVEIVYVGVIMTLLWIAIAVVGILLIVSIVVGDD